MRRVFDPLDWNMTFAEPRWLSPTSAWIEHIPFGMALVEMLRPATIVELGTQRGDSYLAFCQAVATLGLPTRCHGIDTWAGDPQMPLTVEQMLAELRRGHDAPYGGFSTLIQSTFDEALPRFADGQIDLLHIDGAHTYEAVKHDLESWRPKVSRRGVILFHDTMVTDRADFGVHRFWAEISTTGPSFNFHHAHGLGLLAAGPETPQPVRDFLDWANASPEKAQAFYGALGNLIAKVRLLRSIAMTLFEVRQGIGRWREVTQQPPAAVSPDAAAALADPLGCLMHVIADVQALAKDDLNVRSYANQLLGEIEQLKQRAAAPKSA